VKSRCYAAEAVKKKEEIDKARDHPKEGAPRGSRKESFPQIDDAMDPEKLAGDQYRQYDDQ
jgi:hypothetical protein